ncbi:hypothetical protein DFH09DRAFT_1107128 [Mycena vulgaris]|nr:hypothetical protein DFH09DRAFT_1107128 [Mycena vulgaris]
MARVKACAPLRMALGIISPSAQTAWYTTAQLLGDVIHHATVREGESSGSRTLDTALPPSPMRRAASPAMPPTAVIARFSVPRSSLPRVPRPFAAESRPKSTTHPPSAAVVPYPGHPLHRLSGHRDHIHGLGALRSVPGPVAGEYDLHYLPHASPTAASSQPRSLRRPSASPDHHQRRNALIHTTTSCPFSRRNHAQRGSTVTLTVSAYNRHRLPISSTHPASSDDPRRDDAAAPERHPSDTATLRSERAAAPSALGAAPELDIRTRHVPRPSREQAAHGKETRPSSFLTPPFSSPASRTSSALPRALRGWRVENAEDGERG